MQALQKQTTQEQISRWTDLWFTEYKKAGYVAVTSNFYKHFFYGFNDVPNVIKATKGRKKQFISLNAFDVNWEEKEFSRQTAALKQIRNIAIDIDQYNLNLTIEETLDEIQALILEKKIPEPNLVLTSRGIQLFYSIDRGASPSLSWLAEYISDQLISKLNHIGADSNAKDMSRVMRVPNSINERNNALVKPYIWNDEAYTLQELQSYCKPLEKFNNRKQTRNKVIYFPINKGLEQHYKTNYARIADFRKLIELRNGDFTGMRNVFLYMYSYHQALSKNTQKDLITDMERIFNDVYSRTDKPMTKTEFKRTVISAHKDAEQFFEHYKANGYKTVFKAKDGIKKPYKTSNVIKKLKITEKEQYAMKSLCSPEVARKKHADYMRNKRRAAGMSTIDEYNRSRKNKQAEKVAKLASLLEQNPTATNKELSNMLNVSTKTIQRFLKVINR